MAGRLKTHLIYTYFIAKTLTGVKVTGPIKPDGLGAQFAAVNKPSAPRESRPCDGKLVL